MGNCKELNIDLNNEFVDEHHLNFFGAYKATDYLSNLLINKYGLKDKRNDSKYKSWDEEYEFYRYFIRSRYNVDIDFDYLKKLWFKISSLYIIIFTFSLFPYIINIFGLIVVWENNIKCQLFG